MAIASALILLTTACRDSGGDAAEVPGFDGRTVRVGAITPLTGQVAVIGVPLTEGNRVYFEYVNEELGGIDGRYEIELEAVDSQFDPTIAVQQYNAIKDEVVMFAQVLGTASVNAVLEQLERDGMVAAPASLDSFWVREQNLLPIGGPYQIQAINGMSWYLGEGGGQTDDVICTLIQDDPYGEAGQQGVDFAAEELGFRVATTARYARGDTEFSTQLDQLQEAGCEVVFLVATPAPTSGILGLAAAQGFAPQWIGQSPTWTGSFVESPIIDYYEQHFLVASDGVQWGDTSVKGMADMLERIERYAPDQAPDTFFTFGYNQGRAVVAVLEAAAEAGDLSREGIIEAMNSIDELTFDGLTGDYGWGPPDDRDPPRASTIFEIDRTAPTGLRVRAENVRSEAAEDFEF